MENKIVIYTFSSIAKQIASTLSAKKYQIIIVDPDQNRCKEAKKLGYQTQRLSLMEDQNINSLHLEDPTIKAFFCLSEEKKTNLFITLSVKSLVKELKIITVSYHHDDNKAIALAGADKIINPYELGALRTFHLLHKPYILELLDNILFSESNIEVAEITLPKNSSFSGTYINELHAIEKYNLIVLGIQDKELSEEFIFYSKGINHKLDSGDTLVLLGESLNLKSFKKSIFN